MRPDRRTLRLLVVAGGALGTLGRFASERLTSAASVVPWGTLLVNVLGSLALGYLIGRSLAAGTSQRRLMFMGVGVMGALTTFGGVMVQVLDLIQRDRVGTAIVYLTVSSLLGLAAAAVAVRTGAER